MFEEKFPIKLPVIKQAVEGVINYARINRKSNTLFTDKYPLSVQVDCFKVPKCHPKIIRIPLRNSMLTPDDEICLIVPELKGVRNSEHEKHVEHYEEMLRKNGVENVKKIMTFHELRTEYDTFELKKRLVDLYDVFLVDGKMSGKTVKTCGQIFYKKNKVPTPVKLDHKNLKEHMQVALSKSQFNMNCKGNSYMVKFGHSDMDIEDLVENVCSVVEHLNVEFPGGFDNFRGLNIYALHGKAISIPIYLSLKTPNEVKVPVVKTKKPKAYKTYKGELSTHNNLQVSVKPTGEVIVKKIQDNIPTDTLNDDEEIEEKVIEKNTKKVEKTNGIGAVNGGNGKMKRKRKIEDKKETVLIKKKKKVQKAKGNIEIKAEVEILEENNSRKRNKNVKAINDKKKINVIATDNENFVKMSKKKKPQKVEESVSVTDDRKIRKNKKNAVKETINFAKENKVIKPELTSKSRRKQNTTENKEVTLNVTKKDKSTKTDKKETVVPHQDVNVLIEKKRKERKDLVKKVKKARV